MRPRTNHAWLRTCARSWRPYGLSLILLACNVSPGGASFERSSALPDQKLAPAFPIVVWTGFKAKGIAAVLFAALGAGASVVTYSVIWDGTEYQVLGPHTAGTNELRRLMSGGFFALNSSIFAFRETESDLQELALEFAAARRRVRNRGGGDPVAPVDDSSQDCFVAILSASRSDVSPTYRGDFTAYARRTRGSARLKAAVSDACFKLTFAATGPASASSAPQPCDQRYAQGPYLVEDELCEQFISLTWELHAMGSRDPVASVPQGPSTAAGFISRYDRYIDTRDIPFEFTTSAAVYRSSTGGIR